MEIYFTGAISGGRDDADIYKELIVYLKKYGNVLTEHIGDANLTTLGENLPAEQIHDRDLEWLMQADVVIAEVSTPSLGVGYEIGRALEKGKNILCLFRPQEGKRLSAMIRGSPKITNSEYQTLDEAKQKIDEFFNQIALFRF